MKLGKKISLIAISVILVMMSLVIYLMAVSYTHLTLPTIA